ncbi:MAG: hypothetical protein ACRDFS_06170 [Chloroflexota bacterium]
MHTVEDRDEAQELCRVYEVLGFAPDRITVERLHETAEPKAA